MATNVSHRIPTAQAHAIADRTGADIIYLTGTETIQELRQRGLPESTAHAARKRGYYCPQYNRRHYPQHEGLGGFAQLETPERFVRAYVLRTLAQWEIAPSPDLVADLTQDGLLACWTGAMPRISRTSRATTRRCCAGSSRSTASGSSASRPRTYHTASPPRKPTRAQTAPVLTSSISRAPRRSRSCASAACRNRRRMRPASAATIAPSTTGGATRSTMAPGLCPTRDARALCAGLCPAHAGAVGDNPQPGSRRRPDPGRAARLLDRRHAPHIENFPRYYAAMLRGLITQHCKRLQREQQRLRPWEEAGLG